MPLHLQRRGVPSGPPSASVGPANPLVRAHARGGGRPSGLTPLIDPCLSNFVDQATAAKGAANLLVRAHERVSYSPVPLNFVIGQKVNRARELPLERPAAPCAPAGSTAGRARHESPVRASRFPLPPCTRLLPAVQPVRLLPTVARKVPHAANDYSSRRPHIAACILPECWSR